MPLGVCEVGAKGFFAACEEAGPADVAKGFEGCGLGWPKGLLGAVDGCPNGELVALF